MSPKYTKTNGRAEGFARNASLESLLKSLNAEMWEAEKRVLPSSQAEMRMPVILIMGPMRSGTTLFTQWLANTGLVAYPTNLLSRFYHAPILGAKIQQLLTDPRFNFRNELGEFVQQVEYRSENGKTTGALAPNEFWYFWRRFLADPARDVWSDGELRASMDIATMQAELIGIMDVFEKPFAAKGMLFNYNIPFLDSVFDNVLFVHIKRDPLLNIASVLEARKRQLGSDREWYSFDIPEKDSLLQLKPVEQVAGQVAFINRAIDRGLQDVATARKLTVQYESFCASPETVFQLLLQKLMITGDDVDQGYIAEKSFSPNIQLHLSKADADAALSMYEQCYS